MDRKLNYYHKFIYELSLDARIKKKDLGKKMRISPQMVGYSLEKMNKNQMISGYHTTIDPAKLGLINVYVFVIFTNFEKKIQNEVLKYLGADDYVTYIEQVSQGVDLLVEFTVPNLSFFNKIHSNFLQEHGTKLKISEIYPVIVKHMFTRKYLNKRSKVPKTRLILSGDRISLKTSKRTSKVMIELIKHPRSTRVEISKRTGLNIRTVSSLIRKLEKSRIIRGYGVDFDYDRLGVEGCILLVNLDASSLIQIKRLVEYSKTCPEVVMVSKIIGKYSLAIMIESTGGYENTVDKLRDEFKFYDYIIYRKGKVLKNSFVPIAFLEDKMQKQ